MYVKDWMTKDVIYISPEDSVFEVFETLKDKKIKRLPVVLNGKLVGIVTEKELLEVQPSKATTLSIYETRYILEKTKVKDVMIKDVKTIGSNNTIEEAAVLLRSNDIGALIVVDNGKLVGIITGTNIFDALIEISGFKDNGLRVELQLTDEPGIIGNIGNCLRDIKANITHLIVYNRHDNLSNLVLRIETSEPDKVINEIKKLGYNIVSINNN